MNGKKHLKSTNLDRGLTVIYSKWVVVSGDEELNRLFKQLETIGNLDTQ